MKKVLLSIGLVFLSVIAWGQQTHERKREFLFSEERDISFSGFDGPWVEFSSIDHALGVFVGDGGAAIINQTFFFRGYGVGPTTQEPLYNVTLNNGNGNAQTFNNLRSQINHGGFWLGYLHHSHKIIH